MAITDTQKVDYLFKKVGYSISKTDTSNVKSPSNETISSPIVVRNESVWQQSGSIPTAIPSSSGNIVVVYSDALGNTIQTTADATASTNRTWKTGLTNWIDPSFGSTYQVKVYLATTGNTAPQTYGTQLFADGSGTSDEWFFDYQSGVLNFAGTNLPSQTFTGKSIFISGARYNGLIGYNTIGNLNFSGTTISSIGTNANIILTANGAGYIIGGNAIFSSITVNSISLSGAVSSNGQMYINANITSTSYTSGALVVIGGIGVSGSINSDGSISATGNLSINGIIASNSAIYTQGYQVLSTNTTIIATGDAYGSGLYNNVALTLADTGVIAGVYGSADDIRADRVPRITVDSKGRITNIANISLTQVGNLSFNDSTISTAANLTLAPANAYIFASNSIISNVANPVNSQDVVTVKFLSDKLNANANILISGDSSIRILDTGSNGRMEFVVDNRMVANIDANTTNLYDTVNIANISFTTESITSTSSTGNILLNASGTGIVQVLGTKALGIPYGTSSNRPTYPITGYMRYNTDLTSIEFWNGSEWIVVNKPVTSQTFNGDGSSNSFVMSSSTTSTGVIVTINGTLQQPATSYVVSGNVITFTETPVAGDSIEVRTLSTTTTVTSLVASDLSSQVTLSSGNVDIVGNLNVSGSIHSNANLYISSVIASSVYTSNLYATTTLSSPQPLLYLTASVPNPYNYEIGMYSQFYNSLGLTRSSGFVRNHNDNAWYLFSNGAIPSGTTVNLSASDLVYDKIITGDHTILGNIFVSANTNSTSQTTGALQVYGGAGIGGNLNIGGNLSVSTINSSSGNLLVSSNIAVGGNLSVSTINSSSGNLLISSNIAVGGNLSVSTINSSSGNLLISSNLTIGRQTSFIGNISSNVTISQSLGVGAYSSGTTGEIRATNNITAYYSSDKIFKRNISDIQDPLSIVTFIGSKQFEWTDEYIDVHGGEDGYFIQKSDFGVIAQDVLKVFPQAVRIRADGSLAVDYGKLGVLAFGAIGQLLTRIEELENRLK